MNAENALAVWSAVCSSTNIRWFLFRETLLCAAGYQHFPETLTHPQVAVFGEDLSTIMNQVVPCLPDEWVLDKSNFGREGRKLLFIQNNAPVFELCVLYGVENEAQAAAFDTEVKQIVRKSTKKVCGTRSVPSSRYIAKLQESLFCAAFIV